MAHDACPSMKVQQESPRTAVLTPATVNTLLLSSFGKLGVCDRAAAVAAAQASGLLEREPV